MFKIIYLLTFIFSGAAYSNGAAANQGSAHSTVSENANPDPNDLSQQLIEAIRSGCYSDVKNLIEAGADVNATDNGQSALSVAAEEGHSDVIRLLIDNGVKIEKRPRRNVQ